jgi:transcriptional regulator with XRE-family HTH domain
MFYIYFLYLGLRGAKMYQRIRDLREDADLRQQDVADYLKCTQVCYSYYESGKRDIPTDVLVRLARYYHVSVDYLLGLTDQSEPYPARKPGT